MQRIIDSFLGAIAGALMAAALSAYILAVGVYNILGVLALFVRDMAYRLKNNIIYLADAFYKSTSDLVKALYGNVRDLSSWGLKTLGVLFVEPIMFPIAAFAFLVIAVPAFIAAALGNIAYKLLSDAVSLTASLVDVAIPIAIAAGKSVVTILFCTFAATLLPIIGFTVGYFVGIKNALSGIFGDDLPPAPPSGAVVDELADSFGRAFVNRSVLQRLRDFTVRLPVPQAANARVKNNELVQLIANLPAAQVPQAIKVASDKVNQINQLNDEHPMRANLAAYERMNAENNCSLSLADLTDIDEPLMVEFRHNGQWHAKVFEASYFRNLLESATGGYARLPENRMALTGNDRVWVRQQTANGGSMLTCADMRIYKGISNQLVNQFTQSASELNAYQQASLVARVSNNISAWFGGRRAAEPVAAEVAAPRPVMGG